MAVACKCDRCKKLFEASYNGRVKRICIGSFSLLSDGRGPLEDEKKDLCDSCFETLNKYLHEYDSKEVTSNE